MHFKLGETQPSLAIQTLSDHNELAKTTVSTCFYATCQPNLCGTNRINRVANVAGTQEPIYGPSAIQSVAKQAERLPYTELKKEHLKWEAMDSTCVETQTFYFTADSGHLGMAQVIYSNVA